jgi:hypothetical protein
MGFAGAQLPEWAGLGPDAVCVRRNGPCVSTRVLSSRFSVKWSGKSKRRIPEGLRHLLAYTTIISHGEGESDIA